MQNFFLRNTIYFGCQCAPVHRLKYTFDKFMDHREDFDFFQSMGVNSYGSKFIPTDVITTQGIPGM